MRIVYLANSDWYLFNFRRALIADMAKSHEVLLLSPSGKYVEQLRGLGAKWQEIPLRRRSLNPVSELFVLLVLLWQVRKFRPDIIHNFTIKCAVYGSIAARVAGKAARVNAVAGLGYVFVSEDLLARAIRPVVRALLRFALSGPRSALILQNSADEAQLCSMGVIDRGSTYVIPGSGVDCEQFSGRQPQTPRGAPVVLMAARLLRDKGVFEFVAAARKLREEGRHIRFVLAGDLDPGNPASLTPADIHNLATEGVLDWLGHVDDMPRLLCGADIAVLPSYREGLSRFLIEAAATGLPIVTTNVPGCRDVVTDCVDGLLVPPRDVEALAAAISKLADDPEMARRLGIAAQEKARAKFAVGGINAATRAVYDKLLQAA